MNPALRSPIPSDYEAIVSWIPDAKACAHWAGPLFQFPFTSVELPSLLHSAEITSYSLFDESDFASLLGFGQLVEKAPGVLRLARIVVSPKHRGLGFGRALCELLFTQASSFKGIEKFTLSVYRDNPSAIALYLSFGFVEASVASHPETIAMERSVSVDNNSLNTDAPKGGAPVS
jgi:ribosomal protein S18 acetylase RimI-like enzyme